MSHLFHKQLLVAIVALIGGLDCIFIEYILSTKVS